MTQTNLDCRHWKKLGYCAYGDACKFLHQSSMVQSANDGDLTLHGRTNQSESTKRREAWLIANASNMNKRKEKPFGKPSAVQDNSHSRILEGVDNEADDIRFEDLSFDIFDSSSVEQMLGEFDKVRAISKDQGQTLNQKPDPPVKQKKKWGSKPKKGRRAAAFCRWLVDRYGEDVLKNGRQTERSNRSTGVVDVAGGNHGLHTSLPSQGRLHFPPNTHSTGKGDLSFELQTLRSIPCTVVDPRPPDFRYWNILFLLKFFLSSSTSEAQDYK